MMLRAWYGESKFSGQPDVEHERQADGHVGVAGEVEVQLQREGQRGAPRVAEHDGWRVVEDRCHPGAEGVRNHHLLEQADGEDEQPGGQIALGEDEGIPAANCGTSCLKRTIGPAIRCGKKLMKRQ